MAFDVGGARGKVRPAMNVTPLVDVVLVLLIIFMVVAPLMVKQFRVVVPEKPDDAAAPAPEAPPPVVMIGVGSDGVARVNGEPVPDDALAARISRVLAAKSDRSLLFEAHDDVAYGRALDVLDLARAGGSNAIAVVTEKLP